MKRRFKKKDLFWLKVGVGGIGVLLISILFGHLLGSYMTKAFSPRRSIIEVKGSLKKSPPLPPPEPLVEEEVEVTPLTELESPTGQKTEDRGQKTEDRGQKTEDRGQKTEDRGQKTEDRGQKTEDRGQKTEDRGQKTEDRGQKTEDRGQKMPSIYRVQAGVFIQRDNAEKLTEKLKAEGYSPYLKSIEKEGGRWYRVQVGAFKDRLNAQELTNELKRRGYPACIIEE